MILKSEQGLLFYFFYYDWFEACDAIETCNAFFRSPAMEIEYKDDSSLQTLLFFSTSALLKVNDEKNIQHFFLVLFLLKYCTVMILSNSVIFLSQLFVHTFLLFISVKLHLR